MNILAGDLSIEEENIQFVRRSGKEKQQITDTLGPSDTTARSGHEE